jgi:hypothetical protein
MPWATQGELALFVENETTEGVHQQASPILKLNVAMIPANDAFLVQLTCDPLHAVIKERFEHSGVKTSVKGRCRAWRVSRGTRG